MANVLKEQQPKQKKFTVVGMISEPLTRQEISHRWNVVYNHVLASDRKVAEQLATESQGVDYSVKYVFSGHCKLVE